MQTERFLKKRKKELSTIFDKKQITTIWRKIVRSQLRNLDIKDLFDHYDFNYNIDERSITIRNEILSGQYKISQSLIYKIEKKLGICRHLIIPQPSDALVLQVLVENISDKILENQPSSNAFYSRDKHNTPRAYQTDDDYGFSWRKQWKELQKKIYKFNEDKELLTVTDISNFYDSIDIKELRKVFSTYGKIDEVITDLLFKIIEEISWKPDYLPYSGRGLPTTNIEAIRLLAHSFLFEIDEIIMQQSDNCFTRWMDDIVIGTNTKREAVEILSSTSDMLKSRGLALNLSKTKIYDSDTAYYHFQIENNKFLDSFENLNLENENLKEIEKELMKKFIIHFKSQDAKYWDKVSKRYITAFSKIKSYKLLKDISNIYTEHPILRINLLLYLLKLGYNEKTSVRIIEIINNIDVFDDISLYQICLLVTQWEIPINDKSTIFLNEFEKLITKHSFKRKHPSDFYCILWFKAKYNHPEDLLNFINQYKNIWQVDSFLRRQVTAILSRLLIINNKKVEDLLYSQISSGIISTSTLANQIFQFASYEKLDGKLSFYLFPKNVQRPYPLSKFLVLCSVLNSENIRINANVKSKILEHIKDPYYLKWLDAQYNIK